MRIVGRTHSRREALRRLATGSSAALLAALGCSSSRGLSRRGSNDSAQLQLQDAIRAVRSRSISPVDLTLACLERIRSSDPRLNAFITLTPERALARASQAEQEIASGRWRGPLHGIPIAIKDNIDTSGIRTTAGSALYETRVPTQDAEVVRRLEEAGAISLGKLNLHELGMGSTSAISRFGPVCNPWDPDRMAGGSSGGSAAAVSACFCFGALGTDTGGSIRIPAACCGVVGLKPSYGVVNTRGVLPLAPSFDCVGPLARTVADVGWLFRAMTDHPVATAFDPEVPLPVSSLRIGVLGTAVADLCTRPAGTEIQSAFNAVLDVLRPLVLDIRPARLPIPDLEAILDAEAYAVHANALAATPELFDPRTYEALSSGKSVSPGELLRLRGELERYRAAIHEAFAIVDIMIVPTMTEPPPMLRDTFDPFAGAGCTFAFNIGGLPALSMPCGFTRSGMPIGLTIAGAPLTEPRVLAVAHAYERATKWHQRRPKL